MIRAANGKTIRALAFRQIKAEKSRNIFPTLAIVLTSVLVMTVLSMGAGLTDANRQTLMRASGQKSEISFQYLTANEVESIVSHPLIKEYGLSRYVARTDEMFARLPAEIRTMDPAFADFTYSTPTIGRLPESENEVAVKSWMLTGLGLSPEIGQTFPLSFMIGKTYHSLELTVCGIWDDDYYLHPYGTAIVSDALADGLLAGVNPAETRLNGEYNAVVQLHANLDGRLSDLRSNLDRIAAETGIDAGLSVPRINYAYENTALTPQTIAAIAFILLIVMISGYLLIYNIFYISVTRDIKHYGLLKTIGTTKSQIGRIINIQALLFCLVGIPLGLTLGYFLAARLFPLLLAATTIDGSFAMAAPRFIVFAAAALLSLITVFISCKHPARIAGKISPVEATRYTGVAITQRKNTKNGYNGAKPARMAFANLFRNRKKTMTAIASVSFGLILFNTVFTFTNSFDVNKILRNYLYGDFLIADESYLDMANPYNTPMYSLTEEVVQKVSAVPGVTDVAKVYFKWYAEAPKAPSQQIYGLSDDWLDVLEESVIAGTFDRTKFLSGKYAVIGADPESLFEVGDTVILHNGNEPDGTSYEVMAKIDHVRVYALTARFLTVPGFSAFLPETELAGRDRVDMMSASVFADSEKLERVRGEIGAALAGIPRLDFRARSDYAAEVKSDNSQFALVGTALCLVVLLIGLLNFVNATMTNILSRKYEFAMLQAVGMTARQSRNMLSLEGLYFVLITGAVFISVGYAASFGIVRMLTENTVAYTYRFTAVPLLICFPVLLLIAVVLPRQAYKGISQNSVVERLGDIA